MTGKKIFLYKRCFKKVTMRWCNSELGHRPHDVLVDFKNGALNPLSPSLETESLCLVVRRFFDFVADFVTFRLVIITRFVESRCTEGFRSEVELGNVCTGSNLVAFLGDGGFVVLGGPFLRCTTPAYVCER